MSSYWVCFKCSHRHDFPPTHCNYLISIDNNLQRCECNKFTMVTEMASDKSLKRQSHKFTITQDVILDHALDTVQKELNNMNISMEE